MTLRGLRVDMGEAREAAQGAAQEAGMGLPHRLARDREARASACSKATPCTRRPTTCSRSCRPHSPITR